MPIDDLTTSNISPEGLIIGVVIDIESILFM